MEQLNPLSLETLQVILTAMVRDGMPPTLSQVRRALGLASDQPVVDRLEKLKTQGLIEWTRGRARGIIPTKKGYLAIGPLPGGITAGVAGEPFQLTQRQQLISDRLAAIDPRLSGMYAGGLRVLLDDNNPERIAQSAHSIRESTYRLSNLGKSLLGPVDSKAGKETQTSNARQLEKLFDPRGGVPYFEKTLYDYWNTEFHRFFVEVSHHREEVSAAEYLAKLSLYENFLVEYVLPLQQDIYLKIDRLLEVGPVETDPEHLQRLLSRNRDSYRYFLKEAPPCWLTFLREHHFVSSSPEFGEYLCRIAETVPSDVMSVIAEISTRPEDSWLRRSLVEAAGKVPAVLATKFVRQLRDERWLDDYASWIILDRLGDLLKHFLSAGFYREACDLTSLALTPWATLNAARADDFHYKELFKVFMQEVPAAELPPFIRVTLQLLVSACGDSSDSTNRSSIWRSAIEDHEQNLGYPDVRGILVSELRDLLERYVDHQSRSGSPLGSELNTLLACSPDLTIIRRLKLHIYRRHHARFHSEIEKVVITDFGDWSVWHEYALLLADVYPELAQSVRQELFVLIDLGPSDDIERDEDSVRWWRVRKLTPIWKHLPADELKRYEAFGDAVKKLEHPDFLSFHTGGWSGPTSPRTDSELEAMTIDEIIDYLIEWKPSQHWFASSPEGLGRTLSAVVEKRAFEFSQQAAKFLNPGIRPSYIYHMLFGLRASLKKKERIEWHPVVEFAQAIITSARANTLPTFANDTNDGEYEVDWDDVHQEIGGLLAAALELRVDGPLFDDRIIIWDVISFLCEHPDPTPEHERKFGGNNMEPFTLSINTTRGQAFHTLFAYIFWCDRHQSSDPTRVSRIPAEARSVLEKHLDVSVEPSLTVRSVYGRNFPWLHAYDTSWASGLVDRLFPVSDADRRYAAWETYLASDLFESVFEALTPQYDQAISELKTFKKNRKYWAEPIKRLAEHMMIAYAYGLNETSWRKFFRVASPEQRGMAVSLGGRAYVAPRPKERERSPDKRRLQDFWEWRLKESRDTGELREFGWWIWANVFDDKWMLARLSETLEQTGGAIEMERNVVSTLASLAFNHPEACSRALALLVHSKHTDRLMLGHSDALWNCLLQLYNSGNMVAVNRTETVIDHLLKLGFEKFREIPSTTWFPPPNDLGASHTREQELQ